MNTIKIVIFTLALIGTLFTMKTLHQRAERAKVLNEAKACVEIQIQFCKMLEEPRWCDFDNIISMCSQQ